MPIADFLNASHLPLHGSDRQEPDAVRLNTLDLQTFIDVTLVLKPEKTPDRSPNGHAILSRDNYAKRFSIPTNTLALIEDFAHHFMLTVTGFRPEQRTVHLRGKIAWFAQAFHVQLSHYRDSKGRVFRGRSGAVHPPEPIVKVLEAVLGLDDRPAATPKFRVAKSQGRFIAHEASPKSFYPDQLADIYDFPAGNTGSGQCIALIELGGGYRRTDLEAYFAELGLQLPRIITVSVDGGVNDPSTADSADAEVMLDIEIAAAVAPGATLVVYFAPNTDKGFFDAIQTAIHDTVHNPTILSISWGAPEKQWTNQSLNSYNDAFKTAGLLGMTICVASGDNGSADGVRDGHVHTDFPASSPFVVACGGTSLTVQGKHITEEIAWHDQDGGATGGGVSDFFPKPDYQQTAQVPASLNANYVGRGVPDVAGNADPTTGYRIRVDGQNVVVGGTSAVAPLMAGLIARINQQKGKPAGFLHPMLYNGRYLYRDILQGNNKTTTGGLGFDAAPGWDACTGLGVLYGMNETIRKAAVNKNR